MRRAGAFVFTIVLGLSPVASAIPADADTTQQIADPIDISSSTVVSADLHGDPTAIGSGSGPIAGLPVQGDSYLVLSTGRADGVAGESSDTFTSTDLSGAAAGADGNDLTQVTLKLRPPNSATCVAFDFAFLSEEYPEYVGSSFNDIFTAELNESKFSVQNNHVVAPNNFAYDSKGNAVSVNTVFGMTPVAGTTMDGSTPALSATSPLEKRADGTMDLILSVQDLGDSVYDSAVLVDNLRWLNGPNCSRGATELTDTDGDSLSDEWETHGIDYDNDGTPEVDLPAMGADPKHRDLFVETDWMSKTSSCVWFICWGGKNLAPQQAALNDVRAAFAAAPVPNPDGTNGIRMHIDSGPSSVMDPRTGATWGSRSRANGVPFVDALGTSPGGNYNWGAFDTVKSANFAFNRRDVFHYVLYANTYAGSESSGISRGIPASDMIITDGHSSWGGGFTRTQERGTFMHELGHGLSLRHGGGDDINNKPGYESIMNYNFQLIGLPPDSRVDYSRSAPYVDWDHLRFDGGSVGDLGDAVPPPATTPVDEDLDPATAKEKKIFAKDGDGQVRFVGPTLLIPQTGTQQIQLDVTNAGPVADAYTVSLSSDDPNVAGTASVEIQPGATERLSVPVDTSKIAPGTLEAKVALSSGKGGAGLSVDTGAITVPDMSDPANRTAAQNAAQQLAGLPADSGLDPRLRTELSTMLSAALEPAPATWTAKLRLDGNLKLGRKFTIGEPGFTPSVKEPASITASSPSGEPQLTVKLQRTGQQKNWPPYTGIITATTANGTVTTVSVSGTWTPKKYQFSGVWSADGKTGSVTLVFAPTP